MHTVGISHRPYRVKRIQRLGVPRKSVKPTLGFGNREVNSQDSNVSADGFYLSDPTDLEAIGRTPKSNPQILFLITVTFDYMPCSDHELLANGKGTSQKISNRKHSAACDPPTGEYR